MLLRGDEGFRTQLAEKVAGFPAQFLLPLSSRMSCTGLIIDRCRVLDSKQVCCNARQCRFHRFAAAAHVLRFALMSELLNEAVRVSVVMSSTGPPVA